jgi:hypothetical protein
MKEVIENGRGVVVDTEAEVEVEVVIKEIKE